MNPFQLTECRLWIIHEQKHIRKKILVRNQKNDGKQYFKIVFKEMNATFWLCCGLWLLRFPSTAFYYHLCSLMGKNRRSHRYNHDISPKCRSNSSRNLINWGLHSMIYIYICVSIGPPAVQKWLSLHNAAGNNKVCLLASYQMDVIKKHMWNIGMNTWVETQNGNKCISLTGWISLGRVHVCFLVDAVRFGGMNRVPTRNCSQQGPWIISSIWVMISRKSVRF